MLPVKLHLQLEWHQGLNETGEDLLLYCLCGDYEDSGRGATEALAFKSQGESLWRHHLYMYMYTMFR